ncbi:MAG: tRNA (adenosine(37)-N6)-dimethylallyltransferase MiaA [Lachnospiraceae bacterium]|nr:tRNA (adenosine(37)-N6)-dimethylallyltransferase MiaA [Lachnospiraceae bacterium]
MVMNKLVIIAGTNASGKSGLGIELAQKYGAEIVSADSRQVFKGLDLGSGKVTAEEMKGVPHHLLDVAEPNEFFSLSHYQKLAYAAIDDIHARGGRPFLVGGTGLYVNAVADGYNLNDAEPDPAIRQQVEAMSLEELTELIRQKNPGALERLDLKNKRRLERAAEKALAGKGTELPSEPRYETLMIGVTWPRDVLYERIRERLDRRLKEGMIEEVENLRANGATDEFLYKLGLEYRYILMYLRGEFADFDAFYDKLFMEIRHLAKEQMTWFRKRTDINWIDMQKEPFEEASRLIDGFLG